MPGRARKCVTHCRREHLKVSAGVGSCPPIHLLRLNHCPRNISTPARARQMQVNGIQNSTPVRPFSTTALRENPGDQDTTLATSRSVFNCAGDNSSKLD